MALGGGLMLVVDYSYSSPPSVAALQAAGVGGVVRYVGGGRTSKHATYDEISRLHDGGIQFAFVNEVSANRALSGAAAGALDLRIGVDAVDKLVSPLGLAPRLCYLTVDFDASAAETKGPVRDYFRGAGSVHGVGAVGGYGGYYHVRGIADLCAKLWQTSAWSPRNTRRRAVARKVVPPSRRAIVLEPDPTAPKVRRRGLLPRTGVVIDPRVCLFQRYPGGRVGSTSVDFNDVLCPDWGQVQFKPQPAKPLVDLSPDDKRYALERLPTLEQGDADTPRSASSVRLLQQILTVRGWNPNGVDGDYGPATAAAVRRAQAANGYPQTGVCDAQAWYGVFGSMSVVEMGTEDRAGHAPSVRILQHALGNRGFGGGTPDGIAGPMTVVAIKKAQGTFGLPQDGVAGRETWHWVLA